MSTGLETIFVPNINLPDFERAALLTGVPQDLAAAGSDQAGAAAIVAFFTNGTGADGSKGVRLPAAEAGASRFVYNAHATLNLKVYPPVGGAINGGSTNAAFTLAPLTAALFTFISETVITAMFSDPGAQAAAEAAQAAAEDVVADVVTAQAAADAAQADVDALDLAAIHTAEVTFTETTGAGTYTGTISLPAGATIQDIIVYATAQWDTQTSATMKVGDTDDDGFYTAVNLKATDLLTGESLSFAKAGGKEGVYINATHVTNRYSASARDIKGIVTTVGTTGSAGRTRMTVIWSKPTASAAVKV